MKGLASDICELCACLVPGTVPARYVHNPGKFYKQNIVISCFVKLRSEKLNILPTVRQLVISGWAEI